MALMEPQEAPNALRLIRSKNQEDGRRRQAADCLEEHLEYYAVVARHSQIDPVYRRRLAEQFVDAVLAITRRDE